jgi:D-alanyl-D-alanine carboxypeptidase
MLRPLRAVAIMTTLATSLLTACNASIAADKRDAALDAVIPAAMEKASVPGAIVGIWQDGRAPYVRTFGVRDTATRQPMATDLYMRIGSTSKTFTVTAMLMLADRGKLGLDDPIDRYVKGVPSGDQITLRQLAAMRSGLYDYADDTIRSCRSSPSGSGRRASCWRSHSAIRRCFRRAAPSTIPTPTRSCSAWWSRRSPSGRSRRSSRSTS